MFKSLFYNWFTKSRTVEFLKKSYIWLVLFLIYIPLIIVVFLSFTDPSIKQNVVLTFENNWNAGDNYGKLFFDGEYNGNFLNSLLNSFIVGIIVTPISLVIGIMATFGIWKSKQSTKVYVLNTSKVTIINPDVITGISLAILFVIAFLPLGWNFGWVTIILSQISFTVPYVIVTTYPKMMKMNPNLIRASYDLNHGSFSTFFRVVIPYLLPVILAATLIAFATSFDDFIITNLVRGRVSTISTEFYTMRKGIKSWAITFGALIIFITLAVVLLISSWKFLQEKKVLSPSWSRLKNKLSYLTPKRRVWSNPFKKSDSTEMISRAE